MSYYHDSIPIWNADYPNDLDNIEVEYSVNDCIRLGWLDPVTGTWVRQFVPAIELNPEWVDVFPVYGPFLDLTYWNKDGSVRTQYPIKIVKVLGEYVADFGDIKLR